MITLTTKFCGPTNTKGSRIAVTCQHGKTRLMLVSWDYSLNPSQNHEKAVQWWIKKNYPEMMEKGWDTLSVHQGELRKGYVYLIGEGNGQ